MKIVLESQHQFVQIVNAEDVLEVYCGNPQTSEDLITVALRNGKKLYCDCLNFDYMEGDYEHGVR